jgi:hypothetical protein
MGPGLRKDEVRVAPGKTYLIEYVDGKGQQTVDMVFWFGDRKVFLFPGDMAQHLRKNMRPANDRVIDAILEAEGLKTSEPKPGLALGEVDVEQAIKAKTSPVNVMKKRRIVEEA